jgi:hypothetical protein
MSSHLKKLFCLVIYTIERRLSMGLFPKTRKAVRSPFSIATLRFEQMLSLDLDAPQNKAQSKAQSEFHTGIQEKIQPETHAYGTELRLQISPGQIIRYCLILISVLLLFSVLGQVSKHLYHHEDSFGFVRLFYVDAEANIPTFYSALAWLLCGLTSGIICMIQQNIEQPNLKFTRHWKWLAFLFIYLAIDEMTVIHEGYIDPLRSLLNASGLFYFTWVVLGMFWFVIIAASCVRLLKHLPAKIRNLLILAGAIFMTGAVGVEMIGGWYTEIHGHQADMLYAIVATLEEALEMLGVLTLLYALLSYLSVQVDSFGIQLTRK